MSSRGHTARMWHREKLKRIRAGKNPMPHVSTKPPKPRKLKPAAAPPPRVADKRLSSVQKRLDLSLVDQIKPWRTMSDEVNRIVIDHADRGLAIPESRQIRDAYRQAKACWNGETPEDERPFVDEEDSSPL